MVIENKSITNFVYGRLNVFAAKHKSNAGCLVKFTHGSELTCSILILIRYAINDYFFFSDKERSYISIVDLSIVQGNNKIDAEYIAWSLVIAFGKLEKAESLWFGGEV